MRDADGHPHLARVIDLAMAPLARLRPGVVGAARGRVLEIGVGTGLNLGWYADDVDLVGIEPDPHMLGRARSRSRALSRPVELVQVGAEALPFPDASFDEVVATFVLCTIPDPVRATAEALRVLRPGGTLRFAEHVASPVPWIRAVQGAVDPLWSRLAGGCSLCRDPVALLATAGAVDVVPDRKSVV